MQKNMDRILVLGASGFIGQCLVRELFEKNYKVLGYSRFPQSKIYPSICGNFPTENRFEEILRNNRIDTIFHLICTTSPQEKTDQISTEIEENIIPTIRLLEGMKNTGTKRIIFASSGGTVYGESDGTAHKEDEVLHPLCGYGVQKAAIEMYLQLYSKRYGLDCRIARISNPYGIPPQKDRVQGIIPIFMRCLLEQKPIVLYGDTVRDYIYIDDVTEALIRYGEYEGNHHILNIGSGTPTCITQIVHEIEVASGQNFINIERLERRSCDVYHNVLDISAMRDAFRWQPDIKLQAGITLTWNKLRKHYI